MAVVGGDLETLAALYKAFTQAATDTTSLKTNVDNSLSAALWTGPNAENFKTAWNTFKDTLGKIEQALTEGATDVKNQHNNIASATGVQQFI